MLQPDYFNDKADQLIEYYRELEDWIINDIAFRLLKSDSVSGVMDRELWKLEQMGLHKQEILKRLSSITGKSTNEIRKQLQNAVLTSYNDEKKIYFEQGMELTSPLDNPVVRSVMNAEWNKVQGELDNLTRTTIDQSAKDLLRLLNQAEIKVSSGMVSYSQAINDVLDEYAKQGVMVDYPTGTRRSLESAVRCCVVTSMNQTAAQVSNAYISEHDIEYVLVSAHFGARHDKKNPTGVSSHDWWQGKVYKINGSDPDAPNLYDSTGYDIVGGRGIVRNPLGLHGYNCRHSHQGWFKGLKNPYIDENGKPKIDQKESQREYELQQKQRYYERAIRQTKRQLQTKEMEINGVAETDVKAMLQNDYDRLAYKLREQNKAYNDFCKDNNLVKQGDRLKVSGFSAKDSAKANGRATHYEKSVNKRIRIPQVPASTIHEKISSGEYSLKLSRQQYDKHRIGTTKFNEYAASRKNPQSILLLSYDEAQKLIENRAGTGIIKVDRKGNPRPQEQISCDEIIGCYYGNHRYHKTNKAVIHYSRNGAHLVPIKGDNYD